MIQGPPNSQLPLLLNLEPRYTDRYVKVFLERMDGTLVGTVNLSHTRFGSYSGSFSHSSAEFIKAIFVTYTDDQYIQIDSTIGTVGEVYRIRDDAPSLSEILASNLAKTQYINRMTTVFDSSTGEHEILAWADKDGQRVINSEICTIVVLDSLGNAQYNDTLASPNSDGVYRFKKVFQPTVDRNFYVIISIKVDGEFKTSHQSFFTMG